MSKHMRKYIPFAVYIMLLNLSTGMAQATVWVTPIKGGEMRFDDWGYTGPGGRTAADFAPINGFGNNVSDPTGGVGQIQHVVTDNPDGLTQDAPQDVLLEYTNTEGYFDANMDGQVNFFNWGYTTVAGSRFDNMQIDFDGDYLVKRSDMSFNLYERFRYLNEGTNPNALPDNTDPGYPTTISFQPYALSDAIGWCGSIIASSPAALEAMAGQVTFDFGMQTYLFPGAVQGYMQVVPGFKMRSYGTLEIDITAAAGGNGDIYYKADAVVNNTNPAISAQSSATGLKEVGGGGVDDAFYNTVSFMGGGIVPDGSWILVPEGSNIPDLGSGSYALTNENILMVLGGEETVTPNIPIDPVTGLPVPGELLYHKNYFAGFTFLMRADGKRYIDAFDFKHYNDTSAIPSSAYNTNNELINLEGTVIRDLSAPKIDLFMPAQGAVNSLIAIYGDNFCGDVCDNFKTKIIIDGIRATPHYLTDTVALFYLPVGADEDSSITIETSSAESATSTEVFDLIVQAPFITNIEHGALPDPQQAHAGDYVIIKGGNFCSSKCLQPSPTETEVCFNGICTDAAWTGWNLLTVQVPMGITPGLATVTVNAPGGSATRGDLLTIVP